MRPTVNTLDHLVLTVRDLDTCISFYVSVLGMSVCSFDASDGSTRYAMYFGSQKINIHQAGAEFRPHATHPMFGSADLCFLSDTPLEDWQEHLKLSGIEVLDGPVKRNGATGVITSLYIYDPDGNLIEIANQMKPKTPPPPAP